MLDRVPVWIFGCLLFMPVMLIIGLLSGQPPLFIVIALAVSAPLGFYLATSLLRDLKLPRGATWIDVSRALKKSQAKS